MADSTLLVSGFARPIFQLRMKSGVMPFQFGIRGVIQSIPRRFLPHFSILRPLPALPSMPPTIPKPREATRSGSLPAKTMATPPCPLPSLPAQDQRGLWSESSDLPPETTSQSRSPLQRVFGIGHQLRAPAGASKSAAQIYSDTFQIPYFQATI
jgi:hypothetical protein